MIVALISDSHGQLPPALYPRLEGVDLILHLGDLGPVGLLADLAAIAPVQAVAGNVDPPGHPELPARRRLELAGLPLLLRHEPWDDAELALSPVGLYLHGHIHRPRLERVGRAWVCCPGALQGPRGGSVASYALMTVDERALRIALHALEDGRLLERQVWPRG
jgi:putative phosphoesterase